MKAYVSLLLIPGNANDFKASIESALELALQMYFEDVMMLAYKAYNTKHFKNALQNFGVVLNPDKEIALHKHQFSFEAY